MIKILKFDTHWIVAEIEEIPGVEFGDPDCVLKYPCEIVDGDLVRFPSHCADFEIAVRSADIKLISEPSDKMAAKFLLMKPKEPESE